MLRLHFWFKPKGHPHRDGYILAELEKHMRATAGELLLNFYQNISNEMVHLSAEYFTNEAWRMIPRGKFKSKNWLNTKPLIH